METKSVDFASWELSEDELQRIYLERLAYRAVLEGRGESVSSMSESARKYTKVVKYLEAHGMLQEFEAVIRSLRMSFDSEMRRLALRTSEWGLDDTWIQWDLAKQLYYFLTADRLEVHPRYRIANPLDDEQLRQEIVDRHIGWEVHQSGQRDPWTRNPRVQELLTHAVYRSSVHPTQPASWALAELGRLIRTS